MDELVEVLRERVGGLKSCCLNPFLDDFLDRRYLLDMVFFREVTRCLGVVGRHVGEGKISIEVDDSERVVKLRVVENGGVDLEKLCRSIEKLTEFYGWWRSYKKCLENVDSEVCDKCVSNMCYRLMICDVKTIQEPVHGSISFDWDEVLLMDTCYLQRLRYVHQTSYVFHVFPGARHSRFEHSLGVVAIVKELLRSIEEKDEFWEWLEDVYEAVGLEVVRNFRKVFSCELNNEGVKKKVYNILWKLLKRVVIYAALLHDIGHGPFSHVVEELFVEMKNFLLDKLGEKKELNVFLQEKGIVLGGNFVKNDSSKDVFSLEKLGEMYSNLYSLVEQFDREVKAWEQLRDFIRMVLMILINETGTKPHELYSFWYIWNERKRKRRVVENGGDGNGGGESYKDYEWGCLPHLLKILFEYHIRSGLRDLNINDENREADVEELAKSLRTLTSLFVINENSLEIAFLWIKYYEKFYGSRRSEKGVVEPEEFNRIVKLVRDQVDMYRKYLLPLHHLINGPVDADKMDYLIRDAYFSGVKLAGSFNLGSIFAGTRISRASKCGSGGNRWKLAFDDKIVHELLSLVIGRVLEKTGAWSHHVHACCKELQILLLKDILRNIIEEKWNRVCNKYSFSSDKECFDAFYEILKYCVGRYSYLAKKVDFELIFTWPIFDSEIILGKEREIEETKRILNNILLFENYEKNSQGLKTSKLSLTSLSLLYRCLHKRLVVFETRGIDPETLRNRLQENDSWKSLCARNRCLDFVLDVPVLRINPENIMVYRREDQCITTLNEYVASLSGLPRCRVAIFLDPEDAATIVDNETRVKKQINEFSNKLGNAVRGITRGKIEIKGHYNILVKKKDP